MTAAIAAVIAGSGLALIQGVAVAPIAGAATCAGGYGSISTYAGNGIAGYSGDGGPATAASLNNPNGVATNPGGEVLIADTFNQRIRKVDAGGTITTIAGTGTQGYAGDGGPATAARLNNPKGVVADMAGNWYVADTSNHRVRKVDPGGTITNFAGNGTPGFSGDSGAATAAQLYSPEDVAVDASGDVYIADTQNRRVRKVDGSGTITTIAGGGWIPFPGDGSPATSVELSNVYAMDIDEWGNVYIADTFDYAIRKVDVAGIISTVGGDGIPGSSGDGGFADDARVDQPQGLAVDGMGGVVIADSGALSNKVRRIEPSRTMSAVAGTGAFGSTGDGGQALAATLSTPVDVAMYAGDSIMFADRGNERIRKVTLSPANTFYFAEGTVRPGFAEYLTIQNPAGTCANVGMEFQATTDAGTRVPLSPAWTTVAAGSRQTVKVNDILAARGITTPTDVSVQVRSDKPIVVERPMYFNADPGLGTVVNGATTMIGAAGLSNDFYFAEGTVRPGFQEYLTLQNPSAATTSVTVGYQASDDAGNPIAIPFQVLPVGPGSRTTINVNGHLLANDVITPTNVSIKVTATGEPIVAERPMYFSANPGLGTSIVGGTDALGAVTPATLHYFAEGTARTGFVEYLTMQNPGGADGAATIEFQATDDLGTPVAVASKTIGLLAGTRTTFNVRDYLAGVGAPTPLNVSAKVTSSVPIVAERPIYFNADPNLGAVVNGATTTLGAQSTGTTFFFAEGAYRTGFVEYLTMQNSGGGAGTATLNFDASDDLGNPIAIPDLVVALPATSRVTVNVRDYLAGLATPMPANVSIVATSTVPMVAERPMYMNADPGVGTLIKGGTDVFGFIP